MLTCDAFGVCAVADAAIGTFAVGEVVATSLLDAVIDAHLDAHAVTAGSPHVDAVPHAAYLLDAATSARRRPPGPR